MQEVSKSFGDEVVIASFLVEVRDMLTRLATSKVRYVCYQTKVLIEKLICKLSSMTNKLCQLHNIVRRYDVSFNCPYQHSNIIKKDQIEKYFLT